MRGSQKANRWALPPIGKPRYIKGITPTLQFRTKAASDVIFLSFFALIILWSKLIGVVFYSFYTY